MATNLTCEDFGLTKEQMLDRLVNAMVDKLLDEGAEHEEDDEEGYVYRRKNSVMTHVHNRIHDQIAEEVNLIAENEIRPRVNELLESLVFHSTNRFGEKKQPDKTLREYLHEKAENYMTTEVDYNGKTKEEDSYTWRRYGTRLSYMVDKHLQHTMDKEVKNAAKTVHGAFAKSVQNAVASALADLRIRVNTEVNN